MTGAEIGPGHDPRGGGAKVSVLLYSVQSVQCYSVQCSGGSQQQWTSVSPSWASRPGGDSEGGDGD